MFETGFGPIGFFIGFGVTVYTKSSLLEVVHECFLNALTQRIWKHNCEKGFVHHPSGLYLGSFGSEVGSASGISFPISFHVALSRRCPEGFPNGVHCIRTFLTTDFIIFFLDRFCS